MPEAREILGQAYADHTAGRLLEAEQGYREVVAREPDDHEAMHLLGAVAMQRGDLAEALVWLKRALDRAPARSEFLVQVHTNLGTCHRDLGDLPAARDHYEHVVALAPDSASALNSLGEVQFRGGDGDDAVESWRRAVSLDPTLAKAHNNLGVAAERSGDVDAAIEHFARASEFAPADATVWRNLGNAQKRAGRLELAERSFARAVVADPADADSSCDLGVALHWRGEFDGALQQYDAAIALVPDHALARFNRSLTWLLRGEFERGWPEYEWRWRLPRVGSRLLPGTLWDGAPLHGRRILLHAEQGLGDTIQFVRYATQVARRGGRVVVECPTSLHELVRTVEGVEQVVARGEELPAIDVHAPLMSLPGVFGTTEDSIPAPGAYLEAGVPSHAVRRALFEGAGGIRVGVVWAGNPDHPRDSVRSTRLENFASLADVGGIRWFSLQKGSAAAALARHPWITPLGDEFVDFADTAAAVAQLDLVIAVDTSVAHLAGALGVPVWLLLPTVVDWRWRETGEGSPWYPTMRLFRQSRSGDWADVFASVRRALLDGGDGRASRSIRSARAR